MGKDRIIILNVINKYKVASICSLSKITKEFQLQLDNLHKRKFSNREERNSKYIQVAVTNSFITEEGMELREICLRHSKQLLKFQLQ